MNLWLLHSQTSSWMAYAFDVPPSNFFYSLCKFLLFFQRIVYLAAELLFNAS